MVREVNPLFLPSAPAGEEHTWFLTCGQADVHGSGPSGTLVPGPFRV